MKDTRHERLDKRCQLCEKGKEIAPISKASLSNAQRLLPSPEGQGFKTALKQWTISCIAALQIKPTIHLLFPNQFSRSSKLSSQENLLLSFEAVIAYQPFVEAV